MKGVVVVEKDHWVGWSWASPPQRPGKGSWVGLLGVLRSPEPPPQQPLSLSHPVWVPFTVLVIICRFLISFQGGWGKGIYPNPNVYPASRTYWNILEQRMSALLGFLLTQGSRNFH